MGTRRTIDCTPMPIVCWRLSSEDATTANVAGNDNALHEKQERAHDQREPVLPEQHEHVARERQRIEQEQ